MSNWDATPEWLKAHGLSYKDARRLFAALATLADFDGVIIEAMEQKGHRTDPGHAVSDVCNALRYLVDGE